MATNRKFASGDVLRLAVASPTVSGDPCIFGSFGGVALTDYDADTGTATVAFDGVYELSVKATNGSNAAVGLGQRLYYVTGDTPPVSMKPTGVFIGYALEAIDSGETETIMVRLGSN